MDNIDHTFRVRELIGNTNATLPAFGQIVFEAARFYVEKKQNITLDFTGIHQLTESFLKSSIAKLIALNPDMKQLIKVKGLLKKEWESEIKNVVQHQLNPYEIEYSKKILNDIFVD